MLLFAEFDDTTGRILTTTGLVSVTSLLALPGGVLLDQGRFRALAWGDLALAGGLFLFATVVVWSDPENPSDEITKALGTLAVATVACAQVAAVTSRLRRSDFALVRRAYGGSLVLVAVAAAMACVAIWAEVDDETFLRVLAAVVVANVFLVILQPILRKTAPMRAGDHRLTFTLDREPPAAAVAEARAALERAGIGVERTDTDR